MSLATRLSITVLVIVRALVPPRPADVPAWAAGEKRRHPGGYVTVPPGEIPPCLADLRRAVGKDGALALFFPGCLAAAAPFMLFRLKREGYSNCRVTATPAGLLVTASR